MACALLEQAAMLSFVVLFALVTPATEVARIQTHLATVEHELRAADVATLGAQQRSRRAALIDELARYRKRGVFPRNPDLDRPTPFFIDDRGVRCAMAHLIETSGGAAFVARIAAITNNAYVRELAVDAELRDWLEAHGLTMAEAARIQPSYPRMTGQRCGGGTYCTSGICEPALDEPQLSFCSQECQPNATDCPVGLDGIEMECLPRGDRNLCVYPEPTPGGLGWPCDPEHSTTCEWGCAPVDGGGVCTTACSNERACPTNYTCPRAEGNADHLRICQPVAKGGCNVSDVRTFLVALLGVPLLIRRRRHPAA